MPVDPIEFSKQLHEDRMARALPTRDSIVIPTQSLAERKAREGEARINAHNRAKATDWLTRHLGRSPSDDELNSFIDRQGW
jgi:hypothetical protein